MRKLYFLVLSLFLFSGVKAQIVNIPDAKFKAKLLEARYDNKIAKDLSGNYFQIDVNYDREIQISEALAVSSLNVGPLIRDLTGISSFTNLTILQCSWNELNSLDVSSLVNLTYLACNNNQISSLNVTGLVNLTFLECSSNRLTSLDVTSLVKLTSLNCDSNRLQTVFMKNGIKNSDVLLSNNGGIKYICVDESELKDIQNQITYYGYANCQVNSYCSFVPGGTFYTIQGNTKLDSNNNGCDGGDTNYPNLKLSITDGTNIGNLISDTSGNYSLPVGEATHTITPTIENPNYYNVSPTNTVVTFPTQASPVIQDFCVTPNGDHQDLEVTILPILRARPGFDASYKIIYKNKGTITQSGSVNLTFDDAVLDVVSATPVFNSQSIDNLSWDYIDLKPFEKREITVKLNVNSPMETPAVNNGDRLSFTALINPVTDDELPVDNSFALRQLVVGSYDPNDKTCLEGSTIAPSAVGKYVHYLIRFENKGTAEAINVVIKDMIDTSKFDVSSLVVTEGSHSFVTKISDTNKVEFIFEKINLPFDDATNDGYVAFKIKTKPSLVLGDSFSNTASIYFDYNFPIITNTATTSVLQSLGTQDFEFSSYFKVYPNPAKQVLNIDVKKQIELSSISIFNTLGQQILVIPNAQQTKQVDVSSLKTGNYFIKVTSNKGSASTKFIKN